MQVDFITLLMQRIDDPARFGIQITLIAEHPHQFDMIGVGSKEEEIRQTDVRTIFLNMDTEMATLIIIAHDLAILLIHPLAGTAKRLERGIDDSLVIFGRLRIKTSPRIVVATPSGDEDESYNKQYRPDNNNDCNLTHTKSSKQVDLFSTCFICKSTHII